jgi:hypothetical protein
MAVKPVEPSAAAGSFQMPATMARSVKSEVVAAAALGRDQAVLTTLAAAAAAARAVALAISDLEDKAVGRVSRCWRTIRS